MVAQLVVTGVMAFAYAGIILVLVRLAWRSPVSVRESDKII